MGRSSFSLIQISDLHLDPADAEQCAKLEVVRREVLAHKPDLIVASGDVSADGFKHQDMLAGVKSQLDHFGIPVWTIPGNHDVGDKPGEKAELKHEYLTAWKSVFDSDRFCVGRDNWMLIGINTQILGSGLHEEAEQFEWLDEQLEEAERRGHYVGLFVHSAPYLFEPDEVLTGPSQYWGFNPYPRRELLKRIDRPHVRLVANGHLHWHQVFERNSALHVWCPSIDLIVDDAIFPRGGGVTGFIRYTFDRSGVNPELVPLDLPAETIQVFRRTVDLPGRPPITLGEMVLDFTGTLSKDGQLLPGVAARLTELAKRIRITVMTADTFGSARQALAGLPLEVQMVATGSAKAEAIKKLGPQSLVAIGNGRNDVAMVKAAAIGIAVVGPEGGASDLIRAADVVVNHIHEALDLVANPLRLKATLRD